MININHWLKFISICLTLVFSNALLSANNGSSITPDFLLPIETSHGEIVPAYNPNWLYKVTNHSSSNHLACNQNNPQLFGCDHIIDLSTNSGTIKIKPGQIEPAPGETVCILPGAYSDAEIWQTYGTEEQPITIRNCGGQVVINSQFKIKRAIHIRILGDGDINTLYGIKTTGYLYPNSGSGMSIQDLSRDIEVAYNDISAEYARAALHFNTGKPIRDKNGNYIPRYDLITGELFVQKNSHIHHNYLHDSLEGEGLYLGVTGCSQEEFDAGTANEHSFVHDNIVMNNGADGIQVGCSRKDTLIFNNYVYNSGFNPFNGLGHTKAIQLGRGTSGLVFNNYVEKAANACVFLGAGPTDIINRDIAASIHNNIFIDCSEAVGFHSDAQDVVDSNQRVAVANNTIINMRTGHFWINHNHDDQILVNVKNNLYVDDELTIPHIWVNGAYEVGANFQESGGLIFDTLQQVDFVNPLNGDYNLLSSSPAIDAGVNAEELDVSFDMNAHARDETFDVGATEYQFPQIDLIFYSGFE